MTTITDTILIQRLENLEKKFAALVSTDTKKKQSKKLSKDLSDYTNDKPKPKRVSGYILFSKANRDEVKEELAKLPDPPKNTHIMIELAKSWKALTDDERGDWNTKAKEMKEELPQSE